MKSSEDVKAYFLNQYKDLEKNGPFRLRPHEEGNNELKIIISLANRWRRSPDSEGKRSVSKILSLYDSKDALLDAVLKDNPILFEQYYQPVSNKSSRLHWLEVSCLCGRETLVNYFLNNPEIDITRSSNLPAYGLSTGDPVFAYRLAITLKEKQYTHQDCVTLYNKCSTKDLDNIKLLITPKEIEKINVSSNKI